MFTHEMIVEADKNGKTYQSKYGTYSKKDGFCLIGSWVGSLIKDYLNDMLHQDCWEVIPAKKMTKEEIEKALGYEIEIVGYVPGVILKAEDFAPTVMEIKNGLTPLEQQAYDRIVEFCFKK